MNKKISSLGLAGILALSSGCFIAKPIDRALTTFSDALYHREQERNKSAPGKKGYDLFVGRDEVLPVQITWVTNSAPSKMYTFSYALDPETQDAAEIYLRLSKEFRDVLGGSFYEERQRVYPGGLAQKELPSGTRVLSYTFTSKDFESIEPGLYQYEWWNGTPAQAHSSFVDDLQRLFRTGDGTLCLQGKVQLP